MSNLYKEYNVEIDNLKSNSWYKILTKFKDANIYQTWAYDAVRYGEKSISHLILKKDEEIVSATQVRIIRIPFFKGGIAYVRWGPLWKRYDTDINFEFLHQMIIAMREEYVEKRGLMLHIIPNELEQNDNKVRQIIESSGLKWIGKDYRTLYIDLNQSLEILRGNMSKSWRKQLNKAEKGKIDIIEGNGTDLFDSVKCLFKETVMRKGFEPGININDFFALQENLPENLKMHVMICRLDGEPIAGLIGSALGEMGIELVAATGNFGRDLGGSHLLRWKMLEYLKKCGCNFYNLNGIDPERNPGVYQFKSGFCGKSNTDINFIGSFEGGGKLINVLFNKYGKTLLNFKRKITFYYKKIIS